MKNITKNGKSRSTWYYEASKHKGSKCTRCDSTMRLETHHIDGDWSNNAIENLDTLCRPCHKEHHKPHRICSIASCGGAHASKGLCKPHYSAAYDKEYLQRPEVKARIAAYMREWRKSPKGRAYRQRPEVREKRRLSAARYYNNHPELKASQRAYAREYDQRPEVKACKRLAYRQRRELMGLKPRPVGNGEK
jgi:hypothetical protein